jgi:hypothetical protein
MKSNQPSKQKDNKSMTKQSRFPDSFTVSMMEVEEHLSKPSTPPWVDYFQECWNPTTKQTVIRSVRRDYAPWFVDAIQAATA